MPDPDDRTTVRALLSMHGLRPDESEVDAVVASLPMVRAVVAALYAVPGVRYEQTAVGVDPRVAP